MLFLRFNEQLTDLPESVVAMAERCRVELERGIPLNLVLDGASRKTVLAPE